jgi:hypothetical protein
MGFYAKGHGCAGMTGDTVVLQVSNQVLDSRPIQSVCGKCDQLPAYATLLMAVASHVRFPHFIT